MEMIGFQLGEETRNVSLNVAPSGLSLYFLCIFHSLSFFNTPNSSPLSFSPSLLSLPHSLALFPASSLLLFLSVSIFRPVILDPLSVSLYHFLHLSISFSLPLFLRLFNSLCLPLPPSLPLSVFFSLLVSLSPYLPFLSALHSVLLSVFLPLYISLSLSHPPSDSFSVSVSVSPSLSRSNPFYV